jgi:hypothetical protein
MFKYEVIQHLVGPWHTPGVGKVVYTWFSKSPKEACARRGAFAAHFDGDDSLPCVIEEVRLWRNGKLLFSKWS